MICVSEAFTQMVACSVDNLFGGGKRLFHQTPQDSLTLITQEPFATVKLLLWRPLAI